ncbi:M16 family metallopeptidase [Pedobacter sp. AW31-3R]|uniref:M16 family metallopeptidase n=1 Tax=Pedobacter sp. AW31-3R TaxID=3445781 RepID=UPI003FA0E2E4
MKSYEIITGLLIAGSFLPLLGAAQQKTAKHKATVRQVHPQLSTLIPLDPSVRTGKLPNGFSYYIRRNNEPEHRVVMYLANKVGSILETEEEQGLSHFLEHMSFNGTEHFPKSELISYLQKSGVRFGADLNAYTSFDETVYQLPLPTEDPEVVKNGLQIMRDWAQGVTLETSEIEKERGVIMEEDRLGKGASERMQKLTLPVILNNSRYASRLPIGTAAVVMNFKPEVIRNYYHTWYRPNLQAIIIVGDIDVAKMEQEVKQKFADLKNPAKEKERVKYTSSLTGKNQFLMVTDKEMTSTVVQILAKHKEKEVKTESDYRASLVRNLFNGMLSNRYMELSRQANPPYLEGGAEIGGIMAGLDAFTLSVAGRPGELENGFKAAWRETRRAQLFGFTKTELERAKLEYLNSMEAIMKEKDKRTSDTYVSAYLSHFLYQWATPGLIKQNEMVGRFIPAITLAEVNAVMKEYIRETDRDIIVMGPEKDKSALPAEATILTWMKEVNNEKIDPFKDEVSNLPLLAHAPVAGKIVKEERNDKAGLTFLTLSNGVNVVLKKTNFKNDQIIFHAFTNGGTSLYSDADYQSAMNAAGIIPSGGVGNYNASQLDKYLSGKQLSVGPYINERTQGFIGSTNAKDMESAFSLLYAYATAPRKDAEIFKGIIANAKAGQVNKDDDPATVFGDTVSSVLGNYHIRRTPVDLEKIEQIDLDRAFAIYKERFANVTGMNFVFVGSIDEVKLKPYLEKYIASLPANGTKETAKDLHIHIPEGVISKTIYKGKEDKATVYLVFSGKFDYDFESDLKMQALKEALEIRLLERLREEESGVYTPSADVSTTKLPDGRYSLSISFGCAPANVEKLIASAVDELEKLKKDGPAAENIDKFKAEDLHTMETTMKTNEFWLDYLSGQLTNEEPLDQISTYTELIRGITPEGVKEIARKYLTGKNYIRFVHLPETVKAK